MTTRPLPVQPQFKEGSDETPVKGDKKKGRRRKADPAKFEDGDKVSGFDLTTLVTHDPSLVG